MPAVTYANVGELAIDVLVSTLQPRSLGALESVNVLPAVGNDAYDVGPSGRPGTLSTALELFVLDVEPIRSACPSQGLAQAGLAQAGLAQAGLAQAGLAQAGLAQAGLAQAGLAQADLAQADLAEPMRWVWHVAQPLAPPDRRQRVVFLQQRAPAALGRQAAFAAELVGWLAAAGAAGVLVLSGLDAQLRRDRQLDSSPFSQQALELEEDVRQEERSLHSSLPPWPLLAAAEGARLPAALLGCFAAEGDNAAEGMGLAAHAMAALAALRRGVAAGVAAAEGGRGPALRAPASWAGLYGRSYPMEIF
ncbi:hypothetical protein GPECTOR_115g326 [Gonium pectorale]|uniref:Proteasome assembly chaperone 2 n=1 Tax=Gonium pectorale TaxID=33097 RepID=A0A150FZ03_GONPE|nr:hypothetical protein GPECTOR_115g326 [Gonium pectorale]|eukprot:KXZ42832.1 hypothetical protein GPECTOR_115g326 [Gonium pectorale]